MDYSVITFYKYENIKHPEDLRDSIRLLCEELNLLGRIIIGKEGINAGVSGKKEDIYKFKSDICNIFDELTFRTHNCEENAYHKLIVKSRKEVVKFGRDVDLRKAGKHIEPKELRSMIDKKEDIILLDARNDYEINIGKFKGAKTLSLNNFREFPEKSKHLDKHKKIVMYCTGGIRCEKASAYLREKGFRNVNQLKGGIINYLNNVNDDNFEGNLFVFDDRLVAYTNKAITTCYYCKLSSDEYINCHNMDCDRLFICCPDCQIDMNKNCSKLCSSSSRQRPKIRNKKVLGIVTNYFVKKGVAEIKTIDKLSKDSKILIEGKTTKKFEQKINELRNGDRNTINECNKQDLVTFPVSERVRVNDKIFIYS